jgi:hypothetical protein
VDRVAELTGQRVRAALELAEVDRDTIEALDHPCGMPDLFDVAEAGRQPEARCATCGTHVPTGQSDVVRNRVQQLSDTLTQVLGAFYERGHPGRPCRRTGWITEDTLALWSAVLAGHDVDGPETGPSATHSPQQATVEGSGPGRPTGRLRGCGVTIPARIRLTATLGTIRVGGRPVGPHLQRLFAAAWNNPDMEWNVHAIRQSHRRRQRAIHAAYRAKTKRRR